VRSVAHTEDFRTRGCEVATVDLLDHASLRGALAGASHVQVICPVAPKSSDAIGEMRSYVEALSHAVEEARPSHIVAISDYGAQVESGTGVTLLFRYLEERLIRTSTAVTLLRSAEHMQNWARVLPAALSSGILPTFHFPVSKQFPTIAAPDLGRISAALLADPDHQKVRIVHAEGPQRYSTVDVAATLSKIAGREIVAHPLPRDQWQRILTGTGISVSYASLITEMFDAHNAGRIDVEPGGQVLRGSTGLDEVLRDLIRDC
jgi:uncharacterized protein YbjT (DUF2867 family)